MIEQSPVFIENQRSIYSILDLLGDVGGLFSILVDMSSILVSWLTGFSGLTVSAYIGR